MSELAQVLRHLVPIEDPNALVGTSTGDDAAVYLLSDKRALVVTVDFFTPIVDDPYDFGRIGAANALSDLYAMGAQPLSPWVHYTVKKFTNQELESRGHPP